MPRSTAATGCLIRLRVAAALICGLAVLVPARTAAGATRAARLDTTTYRFEIAPGPLASALDTFLDVTGSTVVVAGGASLDGLSTPGVVGVYPADRALALLLEGTGLAARLTGVLTFTLDVQGMSERVEVVGRAGYQAESSDTATRTLVPIRDVPQAITVVTRATIADQSMQSLGDVLRYVPGVGSAQGEGNRDTAVFRGTSSTSDFYVDGLRDDVQYYRDLYNVERVEALKGPNAMIFGRGGAGGVINRSTRQADWSSVREATLQAGTFDNRRATFDVGDRLGNTAAARATAVYENSGSYRDGVSLERYGVNPTVAFVPGAATIVRAGYEFFHDERTADRGVPSLGDRPFPTAASAFFGDSAQSDSRATVHAVALGVDHRFGRAVSLKNRTRLASYDKFYQNVYASGPVTADGTTVPLAAYNNATDRANLFNQTDLSMQARTGAVRHTIVAGAELGRQETDNVRNTGYFASGATTLRVPADAADVRVPVTYRLALTDADNHGIATVVAVYAQDQVEFSSKFEAVVGVRYDDFRMDFTNNRTGVRFGSTDRLVSPRAGLVFKPVEPVSLYASYSLAYVPRAGEQLSSLSLSNRALDPEQFRNYEVGAKWDATPGLAVTAAIYRLDRTNVVVPDPTDATRSILVDGQRTKGVEIGASGSVTRAWQIAGAYAFQDGVLTNTLSSTAPAGAVLAQLPRHTLSIWNRYDFTSRWGGGLGLVYRGEMFTSTDNAVALPSFVRADAAVFAAISEHLRAQLNLENLFDAHYYASAHNNFNITPGSPRAIRVSVSTRF
jgi:catecholate siderophore receptor